MNILRERVTRISLSPHLNYATGWSMRVWREEPMDSNRSFEPQRTLPDTDVIQTIQKFVSMANSPLEVAKAVVALERVNAVEIVDVTGAGEVLYKDWP